jgi:allantoate deiminase
MLHHAEQCIARCRALALHTEQPGGTTRTFLSQPMQEVHRELASWMRAAGMTAAIDGAGNLRGRFEAANSNANAPTLWIGSHLDTVPNAGAFDGILGVVLGVKLVELLNGKRLPFAIEVVGFSEEEGVRFGFPFIGSRYLTGDLDSATLARQDASGTSVAQAIRDFGIEPVVEPGVEPGAEPDITAALGYLEFHIEQGPVLEALNLPLGIVTGISGQSRLRLTFEGRAGHAGTTPMPHRQDALAGAAEWILAVEEHAAAAEGLVATVGHIEAFPGAPNVIPGKVTVSLDVRHQQDKLRQQTAAALIHSAKTIATRRKLQLTWELSLEQAGVPMDTTLTKTLARAVQQVGYTAHPMQSGAGHDAMIMARKMPATMLFLRSPAGLSHHPDESVLPQDVAAALAVGSAFLQDCA